MGKTLIIKGADFSAVSVDKLEDKVIDFTLADVKNYNIGTATNTVNLIAPTGGNPSFYEVDCTGYDQLVISATNARVAITKTKLPSTTGGKNLSINSYLANTISDSYYATISSPSTISLPNGSRYVYIRRTISDGTDTTPSSATLKAV